MDFSITWKRYRLRDGSKFGLTYTTDLQKLPKKSGVYIFARKWGSGFEALYVGKANNIRARVGQQLDRNRLMKHLEDAANGMRVVYAGVFSPKPGQRLAVCLPIIEKALIRYFVSEKHDIVNKQGKKLRQHTVYSDGSFPRRTMSKEISVER